MRTHIRFSIAFIFMLFFVSKLNAQTKDSIAVKTTINQGMEPKQLSWINFKFFDIETKKQIKAAAINVRGIKIISNTNTGEIEIAIPPKIYKIWVNSPFYKPSKTYKIKTETKNNYEIDVYLTPSKEPLHNPNEFN